MSSRFANIRKSSVDRDLLQLALAESRILLTEDKDLGWLVFAASLTSPGVVLIRFPAPVRSLIPNAVLKAGYGISGTPGRFVCCAEAGRGADQFRPANRVMPRLYSRRPSVMHVSSAIGYCAFANFRRRGGYEEGGLEVVSPFAGREVAFGPCKYSSRPTNRRLSVARRGAARLAADRATRG